MSPPETHRPAPGGNQGRATSDAVSEAARSSHDTAPASTTRNGPRRCVTVAAHERWRESLAGGPAFDPDDDILDDETALLIDRPLSLPLQYGWFFAIEVAPLDFVRLDRAIRRREGRVAA